MSCFSALGLKDAGSAHDAVLLALEAHLKACGAAHRYEEAGRTSARMREMRQQGLELAKDQARSQAASDQEALAALQQAELAQFESSWAERLADFEECADAAARSLTARHRAEHAAYMGKLAEEDRLVRSSKLLEMRTVQERLAKLRMWDEAAARRKEADALEARARAQHERKQKSRFSLLSDKFLQRQALDLSGLEQRVAAGREELLCVREADSARLRTAHAIQQQRGKATSLPGHVLFSPRLGCEGGSSSPHSGRSCSPLRPPASPRIVPCPEARQLYRQSSPLSNQRPMSAQRGGSLGPAACVPQAVARRDACSVDLALTPRSKTKFRASISDCPPETRFFMCAGA